MKLRHIIVPTDFSDNARNAATFALWLADNHRSKVTMMHVVLPGTGELDVPVISAGDTVNRIRTAEEVMEIFKQSVLTQLAERYRLRNEIEIDLEIRVGAAPVELMSSIKENEVNLIVMGTRGEHNRLDELFGSVTTATIKRAPIPVLVIPGNADKIGFDVVGFATDLDSDDAMAIWQASKILQPFHPAMRVLHVDSNARGEGKAMHDFKEFLTGRPVALQMTFHSVDGDNIETAVTDFANDHDLDLIAVHSPKRNWLERIGHHSVSRNLVLHTEVPILVMR